MKISDKITIISFAVVMTLFLLMTAELELIDFFWVFPMITTMGVMMWKT